MFLVNTETRQQLEVLIKRKLTLQKSLRDINSRMCCMSFTPLNIPMVSNTLLDGFECQRILLMNQLNDVQSKIDELQDK